MKVGLVVAVYKDNTYIINYIKHYINIGVDKIIIIDNNELDGENPLDVLTDEIKPYIIYENKRGIKFLERQMNFCTEMFWKYHCDFDYLMFFDSDEYLFLNKHNNVKEYLCDDKIKNANIIHVNWIIYGDNNKLYFENIPTTERFTQRCSDNSNEKLLKFNSHTKLIIKCDDWGYYFDNPHYVRISFIHPNSNIFPISIDGNGNDAQLSNAFINPPQYDYIELRHYMSRSTEEWFNRRILRGSKRFDGTLVNIKEEIEKYMLYNTITPEKVDYINQCVSNLRNNQIIQY